jgi:hypothetical protein
MITHLCDNFIQSIKSAQILSLQVNMKRSDLSQIDFNFGHYLII